APWQYLLPSKRKGSPAEPFQAFRLQLAIMLKDMRYMQLRFPSAPTAEVLATDARTCEGVDDQSIDLVLTSPPYANNYDYADATRLEMSFLGEIRQWGDLQAAVRDRL